MKTVVIYAVAFIVLANGHAEIRGNSNHRNGLDNANPYKRLLRTRSVGDPKICEPGDTMMQDCNRCFCIGDGTRWGCTLMGCIEDPINYTLLDTTTAQSDRVIPTERVKRDFHGYPRHQLDSPYRRLMRTRRTEQVCEPGATKMIECNRCICARDGTAWGCTRKGCSSSVIARVG